MAKIRTQQIIEAAKQAYTPVKVDYSGYVKGMAAINKLIIDKVGVANEQETKLMDYEQEDFAGINKSILSEENIAFLTDIRTQMAEDSQAMKMSAGFSKKHKQASKRWNDNLLLLQKLKKDATTYTDWAKGINKNKDFLSDYQGPLDQNFLASVSAEPDIVNSNIKFTKEGMLVFDMGVEDLPSGTTFTDGAAVSTAVSDSINNIEVYINNEAYDDNKKALVINDFEMALKGLTSNAIGSGIFDYKYATKDGIVSYTDVLFEENTDLKAAYEQRIQESLSEEDPIDTDIEKEKLKKMLVRNMDGFNLEKIKDSFKNWIYSEVFENASSVASKAYKKKITKRNKSRVPTADQIKTRKATQGIHVDSGKFMTKTENGTMLIGGDVVLSSVILREITGLNFEDHDDGSPKTFRMKADGTLQVEWRKKVDDDNYVHSWKDAGVQADSQIQQNRDGYNKIVKYIKDRVADVELEEAEHYFVQFGKLRDDVDPANRYIKVGQWYSEKVTHTRGSSYINRGAPAVWFEDEDDQDTIPKVMAWIKDMGFNIIRNDESCEGMINTDDTFYICNDSSYKNSFKLFTPDGKGGTNGTGVVRYYTNYKSGANSNALNIDALVNNWYRRAYKNLKVKDIAIEDPNEPGTSLNKTQHEGQAI